MCESKLSSVFLTATCNDENLLLKRWHFGKADWLSFRALCQSRLTEEAVLSAEDPASIFTSRPIYPAQEYTPSGVPRMHKLTTNTP